MGCIGCFLPGNLFTGFVSSDQDNPKPHPQPIVGLDNCHWFDLLRLLGFFILFWNRLLEWNHRLSYFRRFNFEFLSCFDIGRRDVRFSLLHFVCSFRDRSANSLRIRNFYNWKIILREKLTSSICHISIATYKKVRLGLVRLELLGQKLKRLAVILEDSFANIWSPLWLSSNRWSNLSEPTKIVILSLGLVAVFKVLFLMTNLW